MLRNLVSANSPREPARLVKAGGHPSIQVGLGRTAIKISVRTDLYFYEFPKCEGGAACVHGPSDALQVASRRRSTPALALGPLALDSPSALDTFRKSASPTGGLARWDWIPLALKE